MFAFLPLCMEYSIVILIPVLGVESCEVGCIADIFEEHAASIFMVGTQVEGVVGLYVRVVALDHEGWGGVPVGRFSSIVRHTVSL